MSFSLCNYLSPFVVLCIVRLNSAQIWLTIISTHSIQPVTQQANTHCIPGNTKGRHSGPCVCLWVIPEIITWTNYCFCFIPWMKGGKSFVKMNIFNKPKSPTSHSTPSPLIETSLCLPILMINVWMLTDGNCF